MRERVSVFLLLAALLPSVSTQAMTTQECLNYYNSQGMLCSSMAANTCYTTYEGCMGACGGSEWACSHLPSGTPNLRGYKPATWSSALVVKYEDGQLVGGQTNTSRSLFVDWAVTNDSAADINTSFYVTISLDNNLLDYWLIDSLPVGYYQYVENHSLGQLSAGEHALSLYIDTLDDITESNENDNEVIQNISVFQYAVNGDINNDGSITLQDAIIANQVMCGLSPANTYRLASVNEDDIIGPQEVIFIMQNISGLRN